MGSGTYSIKKGTFCLSPTSRCQLYELLGLQTPSLRVCRVWIRYPPEDIFADAGSSAEDTKPLEEHDTHPLLARLELFRGLIHRSAWNRNSRKSRCRILDKTA